MAPLSLANRPRFLLLLLFLLVLTWWIGVWTQLNRSVLTRVPILDEKYYLEEGAAIAGGRLLPDFPFIMSPLYPYLVAASGSGRLVDEDGVRLGPPPLGIRILHLLCWGGIVWLLLAAGKKLLPRWAAPLPALLFALYRPAAIFASATLLEIPLTLMVTAFLYLITLARRARERLGGAALAGFLLGLATLLRTSAVLLILPGFLALRSLPQVRRRLVVLGAALLVTLAPVLLFNSLHAGRPAGVSCNGGLNLYIGNGPAADGLFVLFAGFDFEDDPAGVAFLSGQLGRRVSGVAEADRIWAEAARQTIWQDRWRAIRLWARKVWLHFVGWEIAQVTPLSLWQRDASWLRPLLVPYGLIAAAGLVGMLLGGRADRRLWPWLLAVGILVAGQSLFFVVSRYRLVLVPALCLFGGVGLTAVARSRGPRLALILPLAAAATLLVQPWGLRDIRTQWEAMGLCNEGVRWRSLGDQESLARAEQLFDRARQVEPTLLVAYRSLARLLVDQDRIEEAERVLAEGVLRVEKGHVLQRSLILLLLDNGRVGEAVPRLAAFLRDSPDDPDMLHNYAIALGKTGHQAAAIEAGRHLVEVAPEDPRGFIDLGILLARSGRTAEAREVFSAGLDRHPDHEDLRHNLDLLNAEP